MSVAGLESSPELSRSSLQFSTPTRNAISGRMHQIFSGLIRDSCDEPEEDEQQSGGSLFGRVHSYSRLMHAHTKVQIESNKRNDIAMAAKLNNSRAVSRTRSETSSPHIGAKQAILPSPVCAELQQLTIDEAPVPPCPPPENGHRQEPPIAVKRGMKQRSTTQPIPRDFAVSAKKPAAVV